MTTTKPRKGYAMVFVLVFIALILSLHSVAHRHISAALRLEGARTLRRQRDAGPTHALAKGLELLETGLPPRKQYVCATTIDTSQGPRSFTITYELQHGGNWSVQARPTSGTEVHPPMPLSFTSSK